MGTVSAHPLTSTQLQNTQRRRSGSEASSSSQMPGGVSGRKRRAAAVAATRAISATAHNGTSSLLLSRKDCDAFGTRPTSSPYSYDHAQSKASSVGSTSAPSTHVGVRRSTNAVSEGNPSAAGPGSLKRRRITTRSGMVGGAPERLAGGASGGHGLTF